MTDWHTDAALWMIKGKVMNLRLAIAATCLAAALSGCATAYQSKGFTGGFSETMLSPDTFKIDFSGNGYTSAERASDFALLRAADKSLELGCNYFGVRGEANSAAVGSVTIGSAGWGRHGAWGFSNTMPVAKPDSSLLVKCSRDQQPGADLFDAHFIAQSIRSKYGIKPGVATHSAPTSAAEPASSMPIASADPTPQPNDYASMVLSAEKLATSMGCGDIKATGGTTFQARCATYSVVIDCDASSCHPTHTVNEQ